MWHKKISLYAGTHVKRLRPIKGCFTCNQQATCVSRESSETTRETPPTLTADDDIVQTVANLTGPAAAVIRGWRALLGFIGCKGQVGVSTSWK